MTKRSEVSLFLRKHKACEEAREWAEEFSTLAEAWGKCANPEWLLWTLGALQVVDDRRYRLLACAFVRETPLKDGRKVWDLLTDERSRNAVIVAERFAEGKATAEELAAAWDAAWDAQCNIIRQVFSNPFVAKAVEISA